HVIANSAYVADRVARELGVPAGRVTAIPGGIDPGVLDVGSPALTPDFRSVLVDHGELLVVYVGRLDPEKGLETLAEAARLAGAADPRLVFAFAGSGRLEAPLAATLAPLGRRARLLGYLAGETLAFLYRAADVVVVPST